MDEGRLGAVRRQQGHHRKSTIVMNDIINFQQNVYTCYLKRERQNTEAKMKAQEVYLKRSIARNSYLLQCLEARKQKIAERAPEKQILGRYGGRPIHAFSRDVDACIAWRHPRLRRLRRVERAKEKGLKIGAIMDFDTIPEKMEAIMKKGDATADDVDKDDVKTDSKDDDPLSRRRHNMSKLPHILSIGNQPNILKLQHTVYTRTTHHVVDDSRDSFDSRDHNDDLRLQQRDSLPENEKRHGTIVVEENGGKQGSKSRETDSFVKNHEKDINNNDNKNNNNNNSNNNSSNNNNSNNNNDDEKDATKDRTKVNLPESGIERESTIIDPSPPKQKHQSPPHPPSMPPPLVRRPTLILPPIQTTKDMKLHGFEGQGQSQGQQSEKDSGSVEA